ncbi:hypothetical protein PF002_g24268 [Phytophthora fragariae]|uniref:Uncharacterized protein n=1 Tax=Phytophthora fragariae TaxID=53985 RepID=A0A6A3QPD7_9STRA|nr:hypothetical protein PF006_g27563 [Phytophthora fragariae]KAE9192215.1 hypothetical protein PF002_g24268 [Phytophthora fragariae]KAE9274480.1 hypothetical protein PF001_g27043 [Phytophthora fragariae]
MSKKLLDSLLTDIKAGDQATVNNRLATLSDEQLNELFAQVHPNKALGTASSERFVPGSFQMKDEFTVDEDTLENAPDKESFMAASVSAAGGLQQGPHRRLGAREDASPSSATATAERYNAALEQAVPEQSAQERVVIDRFLERLFRFNPDLHRQADGQSFVGDPVHTDVSLLEGTDVAYDNIPPNDTHSRFNSYYEINYEALRVATQQIYNVKPDLEHAKIVYNVLDSQAEEKDGALGEELLKNRVKSKKVKAEKVFGKDSPAFDA